MRIALDISQIVYKGSGVARFTQGLIETIVSAPKKHDWVFFFSGLRSSLDPFLEQNIKSAGFTLIKRRFPPRFLSFVWNDLHVNMIDHYVGPVDWIITSDWTEPPSRYKKATVVHDLTFVRYPETLDSLIHSTQKKRLAWVKKESDLIIADSEATKKDLVDLMLIDKKRIRVIYPGVAMNKPSAQKKSAVLEKYSLDKQFILTVGKIEPRKNLERLFKAYEKVHQQKPELELIVVGQSGWGESPAEVEGIRFLGYLPDDELAALYASCLCFIYPSLWEGFGYPVVEAMIQGAPTATSITSSTGEIAQSAALLFDPKNTGEIELKLWKLINDKALRTELKEKGKARAAQFTWDKYYARLVEILEKHT